MKYTTIPIASSFQATANALSHVVYVVPPSCKLIVTSLTTNTSTLALMADGRQIAALTSGTFLATNIVVDGGQSLVVSAGGACFFSVNGILISPVDGMTITPTVKDAPIPQGAKVDIIKNGSTYEARLEQRSGAKEAYVSNASCQNFYNALKVVPMSMNQAVIVYLDGSYYLCAYLIGWDENGRVITYNNTTLDSNSHQASSQTTRPFEVVRVDSRRLVIVSARANSTTRYCYLAKVTAPREYPMLTLKHSSTTITSTCSSYTCQDQDVCFCETNKLIAVLQSSDGSSASSCDAYVLTVDTSAETVTAGAKYAIKSCTAYTNSPQRLALAIGLGAGKFIAGWHEITVQLKACTYSGTSVTAAGTAVSIPSTGYYTHQGGARVAQDGSTFIVATYISQLILTPGSVSGTTITLGAGTFIGSNGYNAMAIYPMWNSPEGNGYALYYTDMSNGGQLYYLTTDGSTITVVKRQGVYTAQMYSASILNPVNIGELSILGLGTYVGSSPYYVFAAMYALPPLYKAIALSGAAVNSTINVELLEQGV